MSIENRSVQRFTIEGFDETMMAFSQEPAVSVDWDNRQDFIRADQSLAQSSETVKLLFGEGVGRCFGDFYCTNNRIRGRCYATSEGILFYTNLLGFERRLCLLFREVEDISLFRTTSIAIQMMDCETYIFKSFNDREQVLQLLKVLWKNDGKALASASSPSLQRNISRSSVQEESLAAQDVLASPPATLRVSSAANLSLSAPPAPITFGNRRRSVSDSLVNSFSRRRLSDSGRGRTFSEASSVDETKPTWEDHTSQQKSMRFSDFATKDVILKCTADQFFELFLSDEAVHSLAIYQNDVVKDKDVSVTPWQVSGSGARSRMFTFSRPLKNSTGFGPDTARTKREQLLRIFQGKGLVLENITRVEGIPSADSFHVQDRWIVESIPETSEVRLTVRYGIEFTKRSLLKTMIQKSIHKETKEWWKGYVHHLKSVTSELDGTRERASTPAEGIAEAIEAAMAAQMLELKAYIRYVAICVVLLVLILEMILLWRLEFFDLSHGVTGSPQLCEKMTSENTTIRPITS